MNIYYHDESHSSANSNGESCRKNSSRFGEFREFVKRRRNAGKTSRQQQLANSLPNQCIGDAKVSTNNHIGVNMGESDEERDKAQPLIRRRFSVPEKTLLNKDYAILRQSRERHLEIVAAFDRHTDPYRQYMQSLLCYDLAPTHGSAVLIDGDLSMRKSLLALHQSGHNTALVISSSSNSPVGMITATDCLRAIVVALNIDSDVGDRSVHEFIKVYGKKKLVTAAVSMSVWDAARLFCLNHVHRIPVFQVDESHRLTDILYILSLRRVFHETIIKLMEPSFSLVPHVKHRTLHDSGIGTWDGIVTISNDAYCGEAIDKFVKSKLSCIAVVDEHNTVLGKISKNDIMRELIEHSNNYLEIVNVPVKNVYRIPPFGRPTNTIYEGISLLLSSGDQCLFIVDCNQRVVAAVAFTDIMDYILNSAEVYHKMSVG